MGDKRALSDYHRKRDPGQTPEPFSSSRPTGGSVFVIHHHWARQRHYDLRLEVDGVLWSWAVPKGPSPDPQEKRLAVQVEPHPVDYAWFEGCIPEGNYGAGAMIVWDRGRWVPLIEPHEGMEKGKMLFELRGHKLHGTWTLVRTKRGGGKEWLLIKENDGWVGRIPEPPMDSVLSGLLVDQLREGDSGVPALTRSMKRAGAGKLETDPSRLRPMLCERAEPFSDPDWLYEIKYDGFRILACRDGDAVSLLTRRGRDLAGNFPEIAEAVAALPARRFVLDGELTVSDGEGLPDFSRLQQRGQVRRARDIALASVARPALYYGFDLLTVEGLDLRGQPLTRRKRWLQTLLPSVGPLRFVDHVPEHGQAAFEQAQTMRLEGLVAKRADSPYRVGERSADWLKLAALKTSDFVVLGMEPAGKTDFRALVVGQYENGALRSFGRVGSGLSAAERSQLVGGFSPVEEPPIAGLTGAKIQWLRPDSVVEVRFKEYTKAGQLRQPVLLRVRDDKPAEDCIRPLERDAVHEPVAVEAPEPPPRVIESNRDKVFWPDGTTKGQVLDHYRKIAEWMLPWLADRPIVMTRYPDGIEGKFFFQHDAPQFLPDWIRTETVKADDERRYIILEDADSLRYIANLGTLPIHVFASRASDMDHPDYCIIDLDPKEAPFEHVVKIARETRKLCEEIGLPCYPKTSGGSGLHVLIPLAGQLGHEQSRSLAELLARVLITRLPEIATIQRAIELRKGRVYVDYGQNGRGKTIAAPYCVREVPGAQVSMPLRWSEVTKKLTPARFTVHNAARRMRSMGEDPALAVLNQQPDLIEALGQLAALSDD